MCALRRMDKKQPTMVAQIADQSSWTTMAWTKIRAQINPQAVRQLHGDTLLVSRITKLKEHKS
jgi:hypothetical protein